MTITSVTTKAPSGRMGVISLKGEVLIPVKFVSINIDEHGNYVCMGAETSGESPEIYNSKFERVK